MNTCELVLEQFSKKSVSASIWKNSKYEFVHDLKPATKGAFGEQYTRAFLKEKFGIETKDRSSNLHDYTIKSLIVENKFSTCWKNTPNKFKFQQIRSGQPFDVLICMAMNPDEIKFKWCTRNDLEHRVFGYNEYRQHAGQNGKQELYWITFDELFLRPIETLPQYVDLF